MHAGERSRDRKTGDDCDGQPDEGDRSPNHNLSIVRCARTRAGRTLYLG
jgi:hypothetical protein